MSMIPILLHQSLLVIGSTDPAMVSPVELGIRQRAKTPPVDQIKQPERKKELPTTMASWSKRATMSSARMGFTAAALEDASSPSSKIVVFGGTDWSPSGGKTPVTTIEQFDVASNAWTTLPMSYGFQGYTACGEMGNDVFLFGANAGSPPTVYGYNPQYTAVTTIGQLAVNRRWPAVVNLKNNQAEILVLGGAPANSGFSNETSIEKYKSGSGTVMSGVSLGSLPMTNVSAALMPNGKVFIVGQKSPGDNRWTTLQFQGGGGFSGNQSFPSTTAKGRVQVAYSAHHQRLLVVIEPAGLPGSIETFIVDPNTLTWTPGPVPPNPGRMNTVLVGSKVGFFLIGGNDANGSYKTIEQL